MNNRENGSSTCGGNNENFVLTITPRNLLLSNIKNNAFEQHKLNTCEEMTSS